MKSFSPASILPLLFVSSLFIQLVLVLLPLHLGHASNVEHDNHHQPIEPSDGLERQEYLVDAIKLGLVPF